MEVAGGTTTEAEWALREPVEAAGCVEDVKEEDMPILTGPLAELVPPGSLEVAWPGCDEVVVLAPPLAVDDCDVVPVPLSAVARKEYK